MAAASREHSGSRSRKQMRRAVASGGHGYEHQHQAEEDIWAQRISERRQAAETEQQELEREQAEQQALLQAQQWQQQVVRQARMQAHAELNHERLRIYEQVKKTRGSSGALMLIVLLTFGLAVFAGRQFIDNQEQQVGTAAALIEMQRRMEMSELKLRSELNAAQQQLRTVQNQRDTLSSKLLQVVGQPETVAAIGSQMKATPAPEEKPPQVATVQPSLPPAPAASEVKPAPEAKPVPEAKPAPEPVETKPAAPQAKRAVRASKPKSIKVARRTAPARAERPAAPSDEKPEHIAPASKPAPATSVIPPEEPRRETAPPPKVPATFKQSIADDPLAGTGLELPSSSKRPKRLTK